MGTALKGAFLFIGAIAVSILLGALAFASPWATPGAYLTYWIFPPGASGGRGYDLGSVLFVHIGTDSLCCFALLCAAYLLLGKRYRVGAFKGVALIIGGLALSILLAMFAVSPAWPTPGAYLANEMFGRTPALQDLGSAARTRLGTDSLCLFAALCAAYVMLTKR